MIQDLLTVGGSVLTLLLMTPTVFFIMQWLLSHADKLAENLRRRKG